MTQDQALPHRRFSSLQISLLCRLANQGYVAYQNQLREGQVLQPSLSRSLRRLMDAGLVGKGTCPTCGYRDAYVLTGLGSAYAEHLPRQGARRINPFSSYKHNTQTANSTYTRAQAGRSLLLPRPDRGEHHHGLSE